MVEESVWLEANEKTEKEKAKFVASGFSMFYPGKWHETA